MAQVSSGLSVSKPAHEAPRDANPPHREEDERHLAVIDMGSNSFRLVVFHYVPGHWFRLVDEIREPVRLSEGIRDGRLRRRAIARARTAAELYAAYCRAAGIDVIDAVATSAIRDAVNQDEVLEAVSVGGEIPVRVLSEADEARYGFQGAVNATTLSDGWFLDVGGGSLQVGRVADRRMTDAMSRPLGAVRLTEGYLRGDQRSPVEARALRAHVRKVLGAVKWIRPHGGRLVGVGGAVRTLAVMHQRRTRYPLFDPHGYVLSREGLDDLISDLRALPAAQRDRLPGLKTDRADIILAAALAIDEVLEATAADAVEVCAHGLREGVMYEHYMRGGEALVPDVRTTSVINAAERFGYMRDHSHHVAHLALTAFDETARLVLHDADPGERELLWAAAMLHDVGVAVDYSSHQRHSEYLVLNTGLPGFSHRETAIISQLVRGHRKAMPSLGPYTALGQPGDEARVTRCAALLRLAEQLDRSRTGEVQDLRCRVRDDALEVELTCDGDATLALWSGAREADAIQAAFGLSLRLVEQFD